MDVKKAQAQCVLVVDDEKNYRILLSRLLAGAGYAVLAVDSPAAALQLLRSEDISLVITDLCMAAADGIGFCKAIAAEFAAIPCIVFTAYASSQTEATLKCAGVSGWLDKPFANQQVLELVAKVLAANQPLPAVALKKETFAVSAAKEVL